MREELITAGCQLLGAITGRLASRQDTVPPPSPRIVVLRRCCLGDVLSSTAMLDALRRRYPLARIDYALQEWSSPALAGNPDVTRTIAPTVRELRAGHYDVAITLERSPLTGLLPWLARVPIRVGPNSASRGFAHNLRVACPPERSEAEIALDSALAIGVSVEDARPKFCPNPADQARAAELLGGDPGWIALAPGGGINPGMTLRSKRWPAERYAELAQQLFAKTGLQSALLGGSSDKAVCAAVVAGAPEACLDLCGRTSFGETAAVIQRCRLFAGNDSAPLFLAAAVQTPFVGIFGPSDPVRHRPLGRGEIVAAPIPRGAYRNGFTTLDCIGMVGVEQVLAACKRMLDAG